jgi:hypothetical protein
MIAHYSLLAATVAVCCTTFTVVTAQDDPEIFIYSVRPTKETELVWAIRRSRFMAIPVWHPGTAEAPLSPNKAVAIANDYVESHLGVHGASILWIYIRPIGSDSEDRWMYDIDYSTDPPLISDDPRLHVSVAMDGKVIVPEKRPAREHIK